MKNNTQKLGVIFSVLNATCLGVLGLVDKIGASHAGSRISFSALSISFSFLFTLVYTALIYRTSLVENLKKISKESYSLIFLVGMFGSGIFILLRFLGLSQSTGTFATLSQVVATCITALLAFIFLKEKLSKQFYILFAIIVLATYFVSVGKLEFSAIKNGDVFILAGTLFLALGNIFSKVAVRKVKPVLLTMVRFFFASIFLLLISTIIFQQDLTKSLSGWTVLSGFLWAGNISFFNLAIQRIGVTFTVSFLMVAPILTMVLEHTFLNRNFNTLQVVASLLVVVAGMLMVRSQNARPKL